MPPGLRWSLIARRVMRVASAGRVAPSLALNASAFGGPMVESLPVRRVILLTPAGQGAGELATSEVEADIAIKRAAEVLSAQRQRLQRVIGHAWQAHLRRTVALERVILSAAFASVPITEVTVPQLPDPGPAIDALARLLGLP
jgi:hypothetical protein